MTDCRKCQRFSACYFDNDDCIGFVPKTMTNADRIRAMTDEELAVFLSQTEEHLFTGNLWSIKTWNEWLKKEADK